MRRKHNYKRDIGGDIEYNNVEVTRFINYVMEDGKKGIARDIVYKAIQEAGKTLKKDPLEVFEKAIVNVSPAYEVFSKRIGGANYQVPREVRTERKFFLACKWMIEAAASGKGKPMAKRLAEQFITAYNGEGEAMRKKENMHKMAEANRAFAHFARSR